MSLLEAQGKPDPDSKFCLFLAQMTEFSTLPAAGSAAGKYRVWLARRAKKALARIRVVWLAETN